ncbi:MAG TPA: hypothetical protein VN720_09395 [Rudaea sp.]|nr:hypothetical protein [Rudaea sp.]
MSAAARGRFIRRCGTAAENRGESEPGSQEADADGAKQCLATDSDWMSIRSSRSMGPPIGATHPSRQQGGILMRKHANVLVAVAFAAAMLQGCNQQADTAAKVQADVSKAEADGQKKVIDAQAKLDQVVAQNNKDLVGTQADAQKDASSDPNAPPPAASADVAKARSDAEVKVADGQYGVDKAKAEAVKEVADARCESQAGDANKQCLAAAKADYDSAVAAAKAKNDEVHAAHK